METISELNCKSISQVSGSSWGVKAFYSNTSRFVGVMYLGAACCLWFVKAWKIDELERLAALKFKPSFTLDPGSCKTEDKTFIEAIAPPPHSTLARRLLVVWPKV